jgi:hypothetical protein
MFVTVSPVENISKWGLSGLLVNVRFLLSLHPRIPANKGLPELVIEHLHLHLKEVLESVRTSGVFDADHATVEGRRSFYVADRRKIHTASVLYHIKNGSVPKLAGTSN